MCRWVINFQLDRRVYAVSNLLEHLHALIHLYVFFLSRSTPFANCATLHKHETSPWNFHLSRRLCHPSISCMYVHTSILLTSSFSLNFLFHQIINSRGKTLLSFSPVRSPLIVVLACCLRYCGNLKSVWTSELIAGSRRARNLVCTPYLDFGGNFFCQNRSINPRKPIRSHFHSNKIF